MKYHNCCTFEKIGIQECTTLKIFVIGFEIVSLEMEAFH